MDGAAAAGAGGGGGGGGGPAPFLLKTYDMVDDSSTDDIVSWSPTRTSFVVWNPPEFARVLLPTYFKHNNFSSFIRQLNTYGFRKIDPERWEFANEEFVKDKKHLLKNIHRRKPIHSHSNPPGSAVDPERAAFEEEIEKLSREKSSLENDISRFKQQQPATKLQLEDLTNRVDSMEERQDNLINFLKKAIQNPIFVENLARKLESMDFSAYNKKRRLPEVDQSNIVQEDSFIDGHSTSRPEFGNAIQQDFSNKLTLELSPAVSDINLVSRSTQSSSEGAGSPERRISESFTRNTQMRPSGVQFTTEPLELTDTGTSFTFINDSSFPVKQGSVATAIVSSPQQSSNPNEELEGYTSCQLNLTLASSPLQVNKTQSSGGMPQLVDEIVKPSEWNRNEASLNVSEKNATTSDVNVALSSSRETPPPTSSQTPAAPQARVNDVFWEQFLTERPGSSDVEEASSNYRANPSSDMQEDRRSGHGMSRNTRILEHLTL